jgi:heme-degrading monooxygenase HmoA
MPVVKINAIHVPESAGPELEKRFAARKHSVDSSPGFLGFQLLRPVKGETRYFVVTTWDSEESFAAWSAGPAREAHSQGRPAAEGSSDGAPAARPVATGADLLEFEVVEL